MHMLCTVVAKSLREVRDVMDYYQDDAWDYVGVGGRYSNIIPVRKNCKLHGGGEMRVGLRDGVFPFAENIEPNPECQYTNIARLRNVDSNECMRLHQGGYLNPFTPYNLILCHEDGGMELLEWGEMNAPSRARYIDWITAPHRQSWWIVILDAHI